jgi:hypothetical protein
MLQRIISFVLLLLLVGVAIAPPLPRAAAQATRPVSVLSIDGKQPNDPGYPLLTR